MTARQQQFADAQAQAREQDLALMAYIMIQMARRSLAKS